MIANKNDYQNWAWVCFLLGYSAFATSFMPLINYVERNDRADGSGGSSCGSSDGGNGGGCGGCGGG